MTRTVLPLWPWAVRGTVPVFVGVGGLLLGGSFAVLGGWVALLALVAGWPRFRWYLRFAASVRRFQTVATPQVVLHLTPEVASDPFLPVFQKTVETKLHILTGRFGFPLRRRVVVYLFARTHTITRLFGPTCGAFALPAVNAIVLAEDCDWEGFVEHELAHLFANRWNPSAPPILREGLAVWLAGTRTGRPLAHVVHDPAAGGRIALGALLSQQFFFDPDRVHDCYALAGSFSGFLIRRFGWDQYHRLYSQSRTWRFRSRFRAALGITFEEAEREWRKELAASDL